VEIIDRGQYGVVEVKDTGVGIAPEHLGHILEPFFTSKQRTGRSGTGLGLAIVHRIVKDSLGYVQVQSSPDQGTTFSLYFPLWCNSNVHLSSRPAPAAGGHEQILVVDDEPVQLRTARRILERFGYGVTTVGSGEEALKLWTAQSSSAAFDLIVLDMMMPGLDGIATLEQIRKLRPGQKALIVTGFIPEQFNQRIVDANLIWLSKPYTPEALSKAVRGAINDA
jgi:CheY-like chemotaxis protein